MSRNELSVLAAGREAPERLALIAEDRSYTYAELASHVRNAAAGLDDRLAVAMESGASDDGGIDRRVAVVAHRTPETVFALLALFELGIPALLVHARLTEVERQTLLACLRPAFLVDTEQAAKAAGEPAAAQETPELPAAPSPDPESILAIVPTSGSSGSPKGVLLSRRAFLASARASAENLGWDEDDRWLLALPLGHVGGLSILVRSLVARRCTVLAPPRPFDAGRIANAIERHRVTLASLVPVMLDALLSARPLWQPPEHLRAILLGGAGAAPALLKRAAERGVPVLTTYGMTETCSQVTTQRCGTVNRGEGGCGAPLKGVELRIMDGEIQLRGPMMMSGYLEGGTVTPGLDAQGWLATCDEGELDSRGQLHVRGRADRLIATGGENVDPTEVEAALESLPGIGQAVAFGVPDDRWGQVVAAALVAEGEGPDPASLRERLEGILAPHKRPRLVSFLERLPVTAVGKVDRPAAEEEAKRSLTPLQRD